MQKKLILLLAFMVLVAVFALQNSVEVDLRLWFWSIRTSMVLILILTFATGALAGILFSLPGWSKKSKTEDPKPSEEPEEQVSVEEKRIGKDPEFEDVNN